MAASHSWLLLNPPYGTTQTITAEKDPITVSVNTATLSVGTYSAVVYVVESGPNGSQTLRIPVALSVTASSITPPPPPPASTDTKASLTWNPVTSTNLAGYKVYVGTAPGVYGTPLDVGNMTSYTVNNLSIGTTYYFAVTSYNTTGKESAPSNEVSKSIY